MLVGSQLLSYFCSSYDQRSEAHGVLQRSVHNDSDAWQVGPAAGQHLAL